MTSDAPPTSTDEVIGDPARVTPAGLERFLIDHGLEWSPEVTARVDPLLRSVPDDDVRHHPFLAIGRAVARSRRRGGMELRVLREESRSLHDMFPQRPSDVLALVTTATALRLEGRDDDAMAMAQQALGILRGPPSAADRGRRPANTAWMWAAIGRTMLAIGELSTAAAVFDVAAQLAEDDGEPYAARHAAGLAALARASNGDFGAIGPATPGVDEDLRSWSMLPWAIARAMAALDRGDHAAARAHLAGRLDVPLGELWPYAARAIAGIHLVNRTPLAGLTELAPLIAAHGLEPAPPPRQLTALTVDRATLLFATGRIAEAARLLEQIEAPGRLAIAMLARIDLANGDPERTLSRLRPSLGKPDRASVLLVLTESLLAAVALWRLGQETAALVHARDSLQLLERFGMLGPLSLVPRQELVEIGAHLAPDEARRFQELLGLTRDVFDHLDDAVSMTPSELLLLRELDRGGSLADVADRLHLSRNTVKAHARNAYRKLGVHVRRDALSEAHRRGLL